MDVEDQKTQLEEECRQSSECLPLLKVLQACNERVARHPSTPETCVQELFDLLPCVDRCVHGLSLCLGIEEAIQRTEVK